MSTTFKILVISGRFAFLLFLLLPAINASDGKIEAMGWQAGLLAIQFITRCRQSWGSDATIPAAQLSFPNPRRLKGLGCWLLLIGCKSCVGISCLCYSCITCACTLWHCAMPIYSTHRRVKRVDETAFFLKRIIRGVESALCNRHSADTIARRLRANVQFLPRETIR